MEFVLMLLLSILIGFILSFLVNIDEEDGITIIEKFLKTKSKLK